MDISSDFNDLDFIFVCKYAQKRQVLVFVHSSWLELFYFF